MRNLLLATAAILMVLPSAAAFADPHDGWRDDDHHEWRGDDHHGEWREHHRDHRDAVVVHEAWRGRPEWRGYGGHRDGYWYAPGYGYRPMARGVEWRRGAYVPYSYRAYYVQDPVYYHLAPAPRG